MHSDYRTIIIHYCLFLDIIFKMHSCFQINVQVKQRSVDARRALDLLALLNEGGPVGNLLGVHLDFSQFKGRLDLNTAGVIGHSFGGATVIQTLSDEQRFK